MVTLSEAIEKLHDIIDDNISGTTDDDGDANGTSLIDSALSRYADGYFGDPDRSPEWFVYIQVDPNADKGELRTIKHSTSDGLLVVHKAFSAQIDSGTDYEIHRFDRDKKIRAWNQALSDCYPWFYNKIVDESLEGNGSGDNEYEIPSTFSDFPDEIWRKTTSGDRIDFYLIKELDFAEIGGTLYFYANIPDGDDIVLVGKEPLTQFDKDDDDSETELTSAQADVVALLAASNLYRMLSSMVAADMSERFDSLANRYNQAYENRKLRVSMQFLAPRNVRGWK